jgi:hypothetical protein
MTPREQLPPPATETTATHASAHARGRNPTRLTTPIPLSLEAMTSPDHTMTFKKAQTPWL